MHWCATHEHSSGEWSGCPQLPWCAGSAAGMGFSPGQAPAPGRPVVASCGRQWRHTQGAALSGPIQRARWFVGGNCARECEHCPVCHCTTFHIDDIECILGSQSWKLPHSCAGASEVAPRWRIGPDDTYYIGGPTPQHTWWSERTSGRHAGVRVGLQWARPWGPSPGEPQWGELAHGAQQVQRLANLRAQARADPLPLRAAPARQSSERPAGLELGPPIQRWPERTPHSHMWHGTTGYFRG